MAGVCQPVVGDPVAGETFYMNNGCANCHGADGTGPPSMAAADCTHIFEKLSGAVFHVGGTFTVTEQDASDIRAWLDSL